MSRILIVDDVELNRYIRGEILRQAGYESLHAATGAEALERFNRDGELTAANGEGIKDTEPGILVCAPTLAADKSRTENNMEMDFIVHFPQNMRVRV